MKRTPWLGNGDGHVYEHVMTPPEARTWTWRDCPSFVLVTHPENAPADPQRGRPVGNRMVKNSTGVRRQIDGEVLSQAEATRLRREARRLKKADDDAKLVELRAARLLRENAPIVQRSEADLRRMEARQRATERINAAQGRELDVHGLGLRVYRRPKESDHDYRMRLTAKVAVL